MADFRVTDGERRLVMRTLLEVVGPRLLTVIV